jgi:hypothetical protein
MLGIRQTSGESQLPSKIRQTLFGELGVAGQLRQTLSAESVEPAFEAFSEFSQRKVKIAAVTGRIAVEAAA